MIQYMGRNKISVTFKNFAIKVVDADLICH